MFAVVIPTYCRPAQLLLLLESLRDNIAANKFTVIIVDNDHPKFDGLVAMQRWLVVNGPLNNVFGIEAPIKGVSHCRNVGVQAAFSNVAVDYVAMIDDDTIASADWPASLINAQIVSQCDLIGGPTIYTFQSDVSSDIREAEVFQPPFEGSRQVPLLRSSNNLLISRSIFEKLGPKLFDETFSTSGGEDTHLFFVANALGMKSYWCGNASVFEPVPPHRATAAWVLQRNYMSAANRARADIKVSGLLIAVPRQLIMISKEAITGFMRLLSLNQAIRLRGKVRLIGALGRFHGCIGKRPAHI